MGKTVVATDQRGIEALRDDLDNAEPVPYGFPAEVIWLRDGVPDRALRAQLSLGHTKWLHCDTAGINHLPLELLKGVKVTKTGAYTVAMAEWIVTAILMACKDAPAYIRASDAGIWKPSPGRLPRRVCDTTAHIVGRGDIGRTAAEMLGCLGCPSHLSGAGDIMRLSDTDWLVIACPLTQRTKHMINGEILAQLGRGAWVINAARGGVVDTEALTAMLDAEMIGGAVLDSHETEPLPPAHPLWGRDNVLILPHDMWRSRGTSYRQYRSFIANLTRYRRSEPLYREADLQRGY